MPTTPADPALEQESSPDEYEAWMKLADLMFPPVQNQEQEAPAVLMNTPTLEQEEEMNQELSKVFPKEQLLQLLGDSEDSVTEPIA